ncbi:hypothetical protein VTN77DRAFT_3009 [Rasamsonia byssochlamydoides]|uniref:uncharacterized protein n=1 Tax=Rasamsonia byssochlamydoides TaxID=89139 RepID=UPI00374258AE
MARLNDLPAPTESIEALKRRFVRQNREIARANSIQSLRIQSLESEVSHLLKENAALREQVISLSHDVEKFEAARSLNNEICTYKDKLASKLAELGSLVEELGMMPQKFSRVSEHRKDSGAERRQSSVVPHKRTAIGSDGSEEDGRLPVILEDKYFPRKTLEPQEVEDISNTTPDLFDSPKIGPPPIAHLDADQSLSPESLTGDPEFSRPKSMDDEEHRSPLASRFETKSTGKENSPLKEVSQTKSKRGASNSEVTKPIVKSGSKRKFSASDDEDEDRFLSNTNLIDDDFQFSRAINISQGAHSQTGTHNPEEPFKSNQNSLEKQLKNARTSRRKVLEPKSTNMRPMSPRKQCTADIEIQKKHVRRNSQDENIQQDTLIQASQRLDSGSKPESDNSGKKGGRTVSTETPSGEETGASESLKDSSLQVEPKDSSHAQIRDDTQAAPSTTGPASRATRRPRPMISYAEPNLRDKMRRPTDELVDAVVPDRFRRISSSQVEKNNRGNGEQDTHVSKAKTKATSAIKGNSDVSMSAHNDTNGETAVSSEDVKFQSLSELPTTVITERKRRTLSANKDDLIRSRDSGIISGSSAYTLMPGGRKAPDRRHREACKDDGSKTAQISAESSPIPETSNETEITRAPESTDKLLVGTVRHARRHSSNTGSVYRDMCFGDDQLDHYQRQEKSPESSGKPSGRIQASGTLHQPNNEVSQFNRKEQNGEISFNEIVEHVKDNSEDPTNTAADGGQIKRSQRAAARRRSMML